MRIKRRAAIAAALFSIVALAAASAACSNGEPNTADGSSTVPQATVDRLNERIQRNEMLFALVTIDSLRLHEIDTAVNENRTIEEDFVPRVRQFVRLMGLTNWDASLTEEAKKVTESGVQLLAALEDADVQAAGGPATASHEASHEFNESAWNLVVAELAPDAGGPGEDAEDASTPQAGMSRTAEVTP